MYTWGGSTNNKLQKRPSVEQVPGLTPEEQLANAATAVLRPLANRRIKEGSCGDFHSLALEPSGQLWSWGGGG